MVAGISNPIDHPDAFYVPVTIVVTDCRVPMPLDKRPLYPPIVTVKGRVAADQHINRQVLPSAIDAEYAYLVFFAQPPDQRD